MKKVNKITMAAITAGMLLGFAGCGNSVDQAKLAQLTGDKNFEQVKVAYTRAVINQNPDQKIYAFWLDENGKKADPTFNALNFETKVKNDYAEGIKKMHEKMKEIEKAFKNHTLYYRDVQNELRAAAWSSNIKAIHDEYIPFLEDISKKMEKEGGR